MSPCVCLSVYVSTYLFAYVYPSVFLSMFVYLSMYVSIYPSVLASVCLSMYLPVGLSPPCNSLQYHLQMRLNILIRHISPLTSSILSPKFHPPGVMISRAIGASRSKITGIFLGLSIFDLICIFKEIKRWSISREARLSVSSSCPSSCLFFLFKTPSKIFRKIM